MSKVNVTVHIGLNIEIDDKEYNDGAYLLGGEDSYLKFMSRTVHQQITQSEDVGNATTSVRYVTVYRDEGETDIE